MQSSRSKNWADAAHLAAVTWEQLNEPPHPRCLPALRLAQLGVRRGQPRDSGVGAQWQLHLPDTVAIRVRVTSKVLSTQRGGVAVASYVPSAAVVHYLRDRRKAVPVCDVRERQLHHLHQN